MEPLGLEQHEKYQDYFPLPFFSDYDWDIESSVTCTKALSLCLTNITYCSWSIFLAESQAVWNEKNVLTASSSMVLLTISRVDTSGRGRGGRGEGRRGRRKKEKLEEELIAQYSAVFSFVVENVRHTSAFEDAGRR